jgi:hypothetical protein
MNTPEMLATNPLAFSERLREYSEHCGRERTATYRKNRDGLQYAAMVGAEGKQAKCSKVDSMSAHSHFTIKRTILKHDSRPEKHAQTSDGCCNGTG